MTNLDFNIQLEDDTNIYLVTFKEDSDYLDEILITTSSEYSIRDDYYGEVLRVELLDKFPYGTDEESIKDAAAHWGWKMNVPCILKQDGCCYDPI